MSAARRAVIDVGTNSVKLLVADVSVRNVSPVTEQSTQTRLGEGFFTGHVLQPPAIERTAHAVADFAEEARALGTASIRVIATSAARDAVNQADLLGALETASGLRVEVISGEHEAHLAFLGVTTDAALAAHPLLILDIGGGSTEFILGCGNQQHFRRSFPLGTVRLLEHINPSDPPRASEWRACEACLEEIFARDIAPALNPALAKIPRDRLQLVGTGGTTTLLARMKLATDSWDRALIESTLLTRAEAQTQRDHLWSLPLAERRKLPGLPPNRADVILAGAAIISALMTEFCLPELRTSTRGLRFGALIE